MSAAEHEAVEVDVNPSDVIGDDDLGGEAAGEGEAATSSRSHGSFFEMLQSTEPAESPEMQDGTLSTNAQWYQHLELAVKKATGATGTPAWVNAAMAMFLLVAENAGLTPDPSSGASSDDPTSTGAGDIQVT